MSQQPFQDPAGIAGGILAKEVYAHAISFLFGYTEDPKADAIPDIHVASGGVLEFQGVVCAITCYHVLKAFWAKREAQPGYRFQIGSFVCEPGDRLRDFDEGLDLAILDISDIPIDRLNNRDEVPLQALKPSRWPSDPVSDNELVILCGFPVGTREIDSEEKKILSVAYPVVEHVLNVDDSSFNISFNRDQWVEIPSDEDAPKEIKAADLNGLSGSPVFSGLRDINGVGIMEFLGTVLAELPFESGVRVRSSRCIAEDGRIARK